MAPKLYMVNESPPVRAAQMVAKDIGLKLELVEMDPRKADHLKPEFLKLNPTHTIPTLVDDDGFVLWDSHAILSYLVEKYGKNDSLYPKDINKRAIINEQLHFETGTIFPRLVKIVRPITREGKKTVDQTEKDSLYEAYGFIETFLETKSWIAGNVPTIADYSLVASISSIHTIVPIDAVKYPKLTAWLKNCEGLPGYEANKKGLDMFATFVKSFMT